MARTAHSIHRTGIARVRDIHLVAGNDPSVDELSAAEVDAIAAEFEQRVEAAVTHPHFPSAEQARVNFYQRDEQEAARIRGMFL